MLLHCFEVSSLIHIKGEVLNYVPHHEDVSCA